MEIPINYLAVLVATVASMVIGYVWYGPLFGKPWIRLMAITTEKMAELKKRGMVKTYTFMFIGALLMNYVLTHVIYFASVALDGNMTTESGMTGAFWNWLGFVVPVLLGGVLWEGKSWKLWLINVGYYLVSLLVAGAIIGSWW